MNVRLFGFSIDLHYILFIPCAEMRGSKSAVFDHVIIRLRIYMNRTVVPEIAGS
ncbi:MAG: hypothetical protein NTW38_10135 [Candidatus Aminicenantes bacterium]|nr:hypothetical protein [Candidatus Aminicenantes bacterium]